LAADGVVIDSNESSGDDLAPKLTAPAVPFTDLRPVFGDHFISGLPFSVYFVETLGGQRTSHPAPTQGQMKIPQSFEEARLAIWRCVISDLGLYDPIEFF